MATDIPTAVIISINGVRIWEYLQTHSTVKNFLTCVNLETSWSCKLRHRTSVGPAKFSLSTEDKSPARFCKLKALDINLAPTLRIGNTHKGMAIRHNRTNAIPSRWIAITMSAMIAPRKVTGCRIKSLLTERIAV